MCFAEHNCEVQFDPGAQFSRANFATPNAAGWHPCASRRMKTTAPFESGFAALKAYEGSIRSPRASGSRSARTRGSHSDLMLAAPIITSRPEHEILEEFQKLATRSFSQNTLPLDDIYAEASWRRSAPGVITSPLDITMRGRILIPAHQPSMAAKFTAAHPILSRLKCRASSADTDAIYGVIEGIIEQSGSLISLQI